MSAIASPSPSVNYGIGNDTTIGVLQRIPIYKSIHRASAVVIAIGLNDMKFRSNEELLQNYLAISERIPSSVPVIFSAVLPINTKVYVEKEGRNQDRILKINSKLENLTKKSKNLFFVDAGSFLVDAQGNLADDLHVGDGVHLNSRGNAIWIQQLKKAIEKIRKSVAFANDNDLSR